MKIFKQYLVAVAATIFISPPAFGQKTDDPGNEAGQKAAGQHSEQGKENSNAQWSEDATRGQDRAAEVRSEQHKDRGGDGDEKKGDQEKAGMEKGSKQSEKQTKTKKGKKK